MLGENGTLIGGLGPEQSRKDQGSKLHRCCLEGSYAYHYTTNALFDDNGLALLIVLVSFTLPTTRSHLNNLNSPTEH